MTNLTRREFLLICGASVAGMLGAATTIKPKTIEKTEYVNNVIVYPGEFLLLKNENKYYIALGGVDLMPDQKLDFIVDLIARRIIRHDKCEIHTLPNVQETDSTSFEDLTITAEDGITYTLISENLDLIKNPQTYTSYILAENYISSEEQNKTIKC